MGCCFSSKNKSNASKYTPEDRKGRVNLTQNELSQIGEPTPESQFQPVVPIQPEAPIPNPSAPSAPNKILDASKLDEILKNRQNMYSNDNIKVEKGWYDHNGASIQVAAKIITVDDLDQIGPKLGELRFIDKLAALQRVVIVYDIKTMTSHTGAGVDIIMIQEFATRSLREEIRHRGLQKPPIRWSEDQLMSFVVYCVEVLAQAQEKGIAHRDIKPANILLFADGDFKFCDFGVSKQASETTTWKTIAGTPPYLSYMLYQAYKKTGVINDTSINWFLQDEVSLALMVLNMARLSEVQNLNDITNAKQKQEEVMQVLEYSENFKNLMRLMLDQDEKTRPDFIKLRSILKNYSFEHVLIGVNTITDGKTPVNHNIPAPTPVNRSITAPDQASAPQDLPPTIEMHQSTVSAGVSLGKAVRNEAVNELPPIIDVHQGTVSAGVNLGKAVRNEAVDELPPPTDVHQGTVQADVNLEKEVRNEAVNELPPNKDVHQLPHAAEIDEVLKKMQQNYADINSRAVSSLSFLKRVVCDKYDYLFKLIIIGDSGVGKTCLYQRLVDTRYTEFSYPTIGVEFKTLTVEIDGKIIKLQIWDTAGKDQLKTNTSSLYKSAHGIIVVYDIGNAETFKNVNKWFTDITQYANEDVNRLLVGNKNDVVDRCVTYEEGNSVAEKLNVKFLETSAKTSSNVDHAFETMVKEIKDRIPEES